MKKLVMLSISIILCLSLTGCSDNAPDAPFWIKIGNDQYIYYGMPVEELSTLLDGYEPFGSSSNVFTSDYGNGIIRDGCLVYIVLALEEGYSFTTSFGIKYSDSLETIKEKIGKPTTEDDDRNDYYYTYDSGEIEFLSEVPFTEEENSDLNYYIFFYNDVINRSDTMGFGDMHAVTSSE